MWPWGHAAVGYLLYSTSRNVSDGPPNGPATLSVLFGTQFPDLVDKPLAWTVGVLPTGRTLAHSLLFLTVVLVVAVVVLDTRNRSLLAPFAGGWLSHIVVDAVDPLVDADFAYLGFLLWPLTTTPRYATDQSVLAHLASVEFTPYFLLQVGLSATALVIWNRDGRPGVGTVRSIAGRNPDGLER